MGADYRDVERRSEITDRKDSWLLEGTPRIVQLASTRSQNSLGTRGDLSRQRSARLSIDDKAAPTPKSRLVLVVSGVSASW
jgi:hypothetical protein